MSSWIQKPWVMLGTGLSLGLLLGVGMLVGALASTQRAGSVPEFSFPEQALRAVATHGNESFAMATGPVSDGVEGVFFLDFLTGDLQCHVVNARTAQMAGAFRQNVAADLNVRDKTPKYLMVTGQVNWRMAAGNVRPADSVVYVLDANTGNYAVYGLPWNRAAANVNVAQMSAMTLVGSGTARTLQIRGE